VAYTNVEYHKPELILPENQLYVDKYPDKKFFGSYFFSAKKKLEFDKWYKTVKDDIFDFQDQFLSYCWGDVKLMIEYLAFRNIILEKTVKIRLKLRLRLLPFVMIYFRKNF